MKLVEYEGDEVLIELGGLDAGILLDVLTEVTAQWDANDPVKLTLSFEEIDRLGISMHEVVKDSFAYEREADGRQS